MINHAELKTDLLQELDRQKIMMRNLHDNPSISEPLLNELINEIKTTAIKLRSNTSKLDQYLRNNE
jgi:Uncharacterized protein conserved in bacteria